MREHDRFERGAANSDACTNVQMGEIIHPQVRQMMQGI